MLTQSAKALLRRSTLLLRLVRNHRARVALARLSRNFQEGNAKLVLELLADQAERDPNPAVFFLVIGACDGRRYDSITPWLHRIKGSRALLVEPVPWLARELRRNYPDEQRFIIEEAVIAEHTGRVAMKVVAERALKGKLVPEFAYGISSITDRNIISGKDWFGEEKRDPIILEHAQTIEVACITLHTLLSKHRLPQIDVLLIDAEGCDWQILKQLDFLVYRPMLIKLEIACLPSSEIGEAVMLLIRNKYYVQASEFDLIAIDKRVSPG